MIATVQPNGTALRVYRCGNADCSGYAPLTLSVPAIDASFVAAAMGPEDRPVIAYTDNDELRLLVCGNSLCTPHWTQR